LEPRLNALGADGWRLHTCEPCFSEEIIPNPNGGRNQRVVNVDFTVVMDKVFQVEEPKPAIASTVEEPEAMQCKN
jgi:hypothetical protein